MGLESLTIVVVDVVRSHLHRLRVADRAEIHPLLVVRTAGCTAGCIAVHHIEGQPAPGNPAEGTVAGGAGIRLALGIHPENIGCNLVGRSCRRDRTWLMAGYKVGVTNCDI